MAFRPGVAKAVAKAFTRTSEKSESFENMLAIMK